MEKHPLDTCVNGFNRMVGQKPGAVNQRIKWVVERWSFGMHRVQGGKKHDSNKSEEVKSLELMWHGSIHWGY